MKSATVVGIGGTSVIGKSSAKEVNDDRESKRIIAKVKSNENIRELAKLLREKGFKPRFGDAESFKFEGDRSLNRAAIIPNTKHGKKGSRNSEDISEEAVLIWTEKKVGLFRL